MDTHYIFISAIFHKGDNFCDDLFAFSAYQTLSGSGHQGEQIVSI